MGALPGSEFWLPPSEGLTECEDMVEFFMPLIFFAKEKRHLMFKVAPF
jgi:hypothetical protein